MNPFSWPGPAFLGLYASLVVAALVFLAWSRRRIGPGLTGRVRLSDPLAIARLRAGPQEALRVACLRLLDQGQLTCENRILTSTPRQTRNLPGLEEAILGECASGRAAHRLAEAPAVRQGLADLEKTLRQERLVPDGAEVQAWRVRVLGTIAVLVGAAGIKILYALATGHHNILFLVFLALGGTLLVFQRGYSGIDALVTPGGRATVAQLQLMFSSFRDQRRSRTLNPEERLFSAAVFGASGLGLRERTLWDAFVPPAAQRDPDNSGTWSSTDSSSGCGSGGGSDSGGGGCGGCGGGGGD